MKEKPKLTFTDEEYEWMSENRDGVISMLRFMAKTMRENYEKRLLDPYTLMQEKDFKIFWNTITDYAHENKISVDINALPFYEDMAKKLSKKYGIDVYKFNDEYIGDQGVYCILILDRIFEGDLKENVNE